MMYRFLQIFLLCLSAFTAYGEVTLGFKGESSASVGIYVKDLRTGQVIAANDEQRALVPASVMKVVTAASAYSTITHDFSFATNIYLSGSVSNGVCNGHIVIASCADPTIDSENFDDAPSLCSEIVDALQQAGIARIKGDVVIEQSLSDAGCISQWEIDDVAWSYGAGLYGFNFHDNYYKLWPATKKTEPHVPDLKLTVMKGTSTELVRGIDSDNLTVYGVKPNDRSWRVNTTMNDPAAVFRYALRSALKAKGIEVGDAPVAAGDRRLIFTHQSPVLAEILSEMMVFSHNLFAEGMLRQLSPGKSRKAAIDRVCKIWEDRGVSTSYNKILDGSGLSRADRLQPLFIANVLEWMANSEYAGDFVSLFPKAGVNGTVKSLLKDTCLQGKLVLKSGSMNAVQCFAGYKLDDDDKPTHVVVVMVNAFYCERAAVRRAIEDFLIKTFAQ